MHRSNKYNSGFGINLIYLTFKVMDFSYNHSLHTNFSRLNWSERLALVNSTDCTNNIELICSIPNVNIEIQLSCEMIEFGN